MSDETKNTEITVVESTRFGRLEVPTASIIELPAGLIGFPKHRFFVMLDHAPPFSWLQSLDSPELAFVVVDGFEFGESYKVDPPIGDKDCELLAEDEYAILVIVTVRSNPRDTTANLKAPVFVNLRNRKGVQVIFDNPKYSIRFPLWKEEAASKEDSGGSGKE